MSYFWNTLEKYNDTTCAITHDGTSYSYKDLIEKADSFKSILKNDSLVAVLCRNDYETLVAYVGVLRSQSASLIINATLEEDVISSLLSIYKPDYIWSLKNDGNSIFSIGNYSLKERSVGTEANIHPELKLLLSTSGSLGSPKLVRLSSRNVHGNAQSIATYLKLSSKERPITTLSMSYSYGLSIVNSHLLSGATILLTDDSLVTPGFWGFLKKQKATSFAGVPFIYEMLDRLRFERMDLPSLTTMTQAGGKLPVDLAKKFACTAQQKGIAFYIMYGQTEATARISYLPPEHVAQKYKSIGKAIPGGTLKLIDDKGSTIQIPNITGELVYQGENVMMGYATARHELSLGDEMNGILHTGDLAMFGEDGFFYIQGRKKRFIKLYGNRVNLDEVDNFLKEEGFECVSGGQDDQLSIAVVENGSSDHNHLKQLITKRFRYHHSAISFFSISKIPRNSAGKILYDKIFSQS